MLHTSTSNVDIQNAEVQSRRAASVRLGDDVGVRMYLTSTEELWKKSETPAESIGSFTCIQTFIITLGAGMGVQELLKAATNRNIIDCRECSLGSSL